MTEHDRLDEMLSELRVLLQGAQMLTTFLIILPFSAGFAKLNGFERGIYIATFIFSLGAVVLLTAPAAHHRLSRPLRDRERFKAFTTRTILWGAGALSIAWTLATQLVVTEVAGSALGTVLAGAVALSVLVA